MGVIKNFINGVKKIITGKEEDDKKPSSSANKLTKAEADMRASSAEMNASAKQQKASGKTEAKTTVKPKEVKLDNKAFTPAAKTTDNWPSGEKLTRDFINYYGYDPRGTVNKAAATNGGIKSEISNRPKLPLSNKTTTKITITSKLTNEERKARIKEINSELDQLSRARSGLDRANMYGNVGEMIAENEARQSELKKELKELERVGTFSASELIQFAIDDTKEMKLKSGTPQANPTGRITIGEADEFRKSVNKRVALDKEINELERAKAEYKKLEQLEELNAHTTNITSKKDFNQNSKYSPIKPKTDEELKAEGYKQDADGKWYKTWGLGYRESYSGEDSDIYIYINDPNKRLGIDTDQENTTGVDSSYKTNGYHTLTPEETGAFNYLYHQDRVNGTKKAEEYLKKIKPLLQQRAMELEAERYSELSKEHPVLMSGVSLGTNLKNSLMFPAKAAATATGTYEDMPALDMYGNRTQAIRGAVSEDMGTVGRLVYNGAMSIGDMGVAFAAGGGNKIMIQAIMSSSAGSSAISEAKKNGASDGKALLLGFGSAAIEWATEKYSVEAILKNPKSLLGYLAENSFTEATEEGVSNISNIALDAIVSEAFGERNEIEQRIDYLVSNEGKTESEALQIAFNEKLQSLGEDVLIGTLTGAGMSSPAIVYSAANNIENNSKGTELVKSGFGDAALDAALKAEGTNSQSIAKTIQEEMSKGNTVNKTTWGELASSMKSDGITVSKKGKNDSFVYTKEGGGLATTAAGSALSSATRYQLDRLGRTMGKNIIPVVRQSETDGWMDTNDNSRFYVNVNSKEPVTYTAIHELTHTARGSEAYEAFKKYVIDTIKVADEAAYKRMMLNIKQKYLSMNGSFKSDSFCEDEIVADVAKKINGSYSEMLKVLDSHPTFGKQLGDKMIELYQNIRGANKSERYNPFDDAESQSIEHAAKLWTQAMQEKGVYTQENNVGETDVMYSIETVPNSNKQYVRADRQVITGDDPEKWSKQVFDYINNTIRKGNDIKVIGADGDVLTITSDTSGKATFRNDVRMPNGNYRKMTDEEYAVKLRAETHIDEIAKSSKDNLDRAVDTKNHNFAQDGFSYRTAYFEDFDGQYYRLTLSVGMNGEINTVYNIGKIKEIPNPVRGSKAAGNKTDITGRDFSKEMVSQKEPSVKSFDEKNTDEIFSMDYSEATDDGKKVSKVYDNSIMGKGTYKEIQSAAEARVAEFMYDGISNKETYEAAQKKIESLGVDKATQKILAKAASAEAWTADDTASALALMAHHQTEGDVDIAVDIASAARAKLTQAGQAIQAMAMIDKLTPEGKFIILAREAESVNESAEKQVRKKGKKAAQELEEAKRKDKARAKQRAGEQLETPENADEGSNAPRDITKVLKKPEDEAPDITKVMKKPSAEDKTTTVPKPESAKGDGKKNIPSKKKAPEKSEVEKVFEKYGVDYVSQDELKKMSETFKVINDLKTKEDLIELIMKQSKQRGTVHNNTLRKALNKQDIKLLTDVANQQVFGMLKDKVKRSLGRKVSTYQTISHLLSARTMARNVVSNAAFGGVDTLANVPAMLVDLALSLGTKQRTVGSDRGVFEKGRYAAATDRANKKYIDVALDVNSSMDPSKYAEGFNGRTFKGKVLGGAERMMTYGLTVTDEFAKGATEHNIYEGLKRLKNNPFTEEEMREIAREEARYRTFQDDNLASKLFRGLKNTLNIFGFGDNGRGGHEFGAGDLVVKYTQVPGALISRSVEFSPLGGLKAINVLYQMHKNGTGMTPKAQRELALSLGRAITGTGLIATFALLSKLGLFLNDDEDEDKDLAALKKAEGMSGMQLNISALQRLITGKQNADTSVQSGDKLVSIAFLEPLNSVIAKGIVLARGDGAGIEDWLNAVVSKSWEEVADMSTMQTLRTIIGGFGGSSSVGEIVLGISGDAITGFIPAPVRQLAAIIDPIQRNPYKAGNAAEKLTGKVMQSLPGLSKKAPAKVTPFGEDKNRSTGSLVGDILNNTVNPGYMNIYQPGEVSRLVYGLSKYNINALPRVAPNSFTVDGVKYKLAGEDYAEFSRMLGRNTNDMIKEYATSEEYYIVENQERADRIAEIVSKAYSKSKAEYLNSKGIMPAPEKKGGVNFGDYDAVTRFNGLPGKEYLEYDGVKYEITETMKAKYDKTIEIYTDKTEQKVIGQNIPLNSIEGFEKAYYYEEGADGKRHRVSYNKPYSEYPMSVKKKIINKIKELAGEQVHKAMKNKVIQGATGSYIIDEETAAAIEKGDFSKNQWVRVGTKEATGGTISNKVISTAKQYIGTPYVWGGSTPKGFDCSGLMQYVYKQNGIELSRTAAQQFRNGTPVNKNNLKPGDMVFFTGSTGSVKAPGHVGMYLGNDQFLHAPQTGDVVKVSSLSSRKDYVGARRVL